MKFTPYEDFKPGDYYIDWCTGVEGCYSGPWEVTNLAKLDDVFVNAWDMIEKVPKDYPRCSCATCLQEIYKRLKKEVKLKRKAKNEKRKRIRDGSWQKTTNRLIK